MFLIDLLWWRNTKRIRFLKIPQKELYQNPKKHISVFLEHWFYIFLSRCLTDIY